MIAPQFVDVSVFNDPSINWEAYKAWSQQGDGISRVAMRSSFGVGYIDQHFVAYRAGALAAGIDVLILYHYGYPNFNRPQDEANYQRSIVGNIRPQDMVILDFEEDVSQATSEWAYEWLARQEANYGGKLPGIYASSYYIQQRLSHDSRLAKYPLWLANWQYTPDERPSVPSPWSSYEFVQYTDRAINIPGIDGTVDANIFLGTGGVHVNNYGPGKADFDNWFALNPDGNWTCKRFDTSLIGGNKGLYSQLSMDGNTLPIIGLPRTNELYQHDTDGYAWSVQFFERGLIVYDPSHRQDSQPGMGASYFGKYAQFAQYDPDPVKTIEVVPDALRTSIDNVITLFGTVVDPALQKLVKDAGML